MKRSVLNSPRLQELKKKNKKTTRIKILFTVVFVFCLCLGLSALARNPRVNISQVEVAGNKVIDTEAIKEIANNNMLGYYLGFLPKTNFLFYPKNKIKNELADKFKRFKNISLSVKNIKTLQINVTEREGKYIWCGVVPLDANNKNHSQCYFINDTGYIFDEAPYFSGEVYFKFFGKENASNLNVENPTGSYLMSNDFGRIITFKKSLEQIGLKPVAFYLVGNGDGQIFLGAPSGLVNDPQIIFKVNSDLNKLTENLQAALTTEPLQTDFKKKYSSLIYIDLRFGNKVYYKFQ